MDDGWDKLLLERSSSSLSLASSQTSVATTPRPKKSRSLQKQPTDLIHRGKKTSKLKARISCRVQTAAAQPKRPTALSKMIARWKRRTPIGDGLPGSWLEMAMVAGRKQLVCRACAHCKPSADSMAHILTSKGDRPRIANILRHGRRIAHQRKLKLFRKHLLGSGPQKNLNLCGELCGLHHQLPSRCGSLREELLPWSGVCMRQSETNSENLLQKQAQSVWRWMSAKGTCW